MEDIASSYHSVGKGKTYQQLRLVIEKGCSIGGFPHRGGVNYREF